MKTRLYSLLLLTLIVCASCKNPWYAKIVGPLIKDEKEDSSYPEILREYLTWTVNGTAPNQYITIDSYIGPTPMGNVAIPASIDGIPVTAIADSTPGVFQNKGLTGITIPNSVTYIGENVFYGNQLTSVTIPNSVTYIGAFAFRSNKLTSVTIPTSVNAIRERTFADNQLTSVTIGNSVSYIDFYALSGNQLTSVTIPASVSDIYLYAFSGNQLTSITFMGSYTMLAYPITDNLCDLDSVYGIGGAGTYTRTHYLDTNWLGPY